MAHIVVVGAGLGGLSAALNLSRCGHTVDLFEARDRVGGRTHTLTQEIPGRHIDAGGEFIGKRHKLWLNYARHFGLALSVVSSEKNYRDMLLYTTRFLEGRALEEDEEDMLRERVEATQDALCELAGDVVGSRLPWDAVDAERYDQMTVGAWLDTVASLKEDPDETRDLQLSEDWLRNWFELYFQNEYGVPTEQMSLLGFLAQIAGPQKTFWTESENFRCAGGAQALAAAIASRLGPIVHLSSPVTAIDIAEDKAVVTAGSRTISADYVVLAIPPSVWDTIQITPALPDSHRIAMGTAVKYLVSLQRRYWISSGRAPAGFHEELGSIWESTDQQSGTAGVGLTVFAGGELADAAIDARDRDAHHAPHLEQFLPGVSEHVVAGRLCAWPEQPWTRGGYSCPAPGQVTGAMKTLYASPWQDRLFFAGEHTSPVYFGYMEGALRSGDRVSEQIERRC